MKLYYIDDTMFEDTAFNHMVLTRFMNLYEKQDTFAIFVSKTIDEQKLFNQFIKDMEHTDTYVITSPSCFDVEGIRGVLTETSLTLEGFELVHSLSGSCIEFDIDEKRCNRIYFELFTQYDKDKDFSNIIKDLEQTIKKKIAHKHKLSLN